MSKNKIVLGKFITLDENNPYAEAVIVNDGRIVYVGDEKYAKSLCNDETEVMDYKDNYIYPGFMDAHTHGLFAGYRSLGQANLIQVLPPSHEGYRKVIENFINENPNKDMYIAAGWGEDGKTVFTSSFLDDICKDKPLIMNTLGGHSVLLNKAAMKKFGITKEYAKEMGSDLVRVDENGEPTGYVCETPAVKILQSLTISDEEAKEYILDWQRFVFSRGFTGVVDAGVELISSNAFDAYIDLNVKNQLKLYTYSYLITDDNVENPKKKALEIAELAKKHNIKHFKIIGAKVFLDGVVEAHTAWLINEYNDKQNYYGNQRFNDKEKLTELIAETGKYNLSVHAHSDGDGATKFFLDCIENGQKISKNYDQRNAAAHLQLVNSNDFKRMADTNTVAVVPPLWVPKIPGVYEQECDYIGKDRNDSVYPIKSFVNTGAKIVFHSDYPISPIFDGPFSVYTAVKRTVPKDTKLAEGVDSNYCLRGENEVIDRKQSLEALTKNVAYMVHEEKNLGSISKGKIANFSVLDKDLLNDDLEEIAKASVIATIVDGEEVFHS